MKSGVMTIAAVMLLVSGAVPATAQQPAPVAASQLNMSVVPRLDADGVRRVQQLLRQKGIPSGPLDGVAGPITKAAVRTFQERYGMPPSGEINNQLLFALGAVDLAGASE
jgi:peptidoglycan hydrolase-like protein with peptidoglycan-binding domain